MTGDYKSIKVECEHKAKIRLVAGNHCFCNYPKAAI